MKAAWLLAPIALLVAASTDFAQTTNSGQTNNQTDQNYTQAGQTNNQTSDKMQNNIMAGSPLRPVDGNYVILAYERSGVPTTGVANRTVTIRNNIMTINTGDANQPAKTFLLRFLPNNHIRLIEIDPRNINNGTVTGTGAVNGTGTTGTGVNSGSGQAGTDQAPGKASPGFNPRGGNQSGFVAPGKQLPGGRTAGGPPNNSGTGNAGTGANLGGTQTDFFVAPGKQLPGGGTAGGPPNTSGGTVDDQIPNQLGSELGVYVQSVEFFAISIFARNAGGDVNQPPVQNGNFPPVDAGAATGRGAAAGGNGIPGTGPGTGAQTGRTSQGPVSPGSANSATGSPSVGGNTTAGAGNTTTGAAGTTATGQAGNVSGSGFVPPVGGTGNCTEFKLAVLVLRRVG